MYFPGIVRGSERTTENVQTPRKHTLHCGQCCDAFYVLYTPVQHHTQSIRRSLINACRAIFYRSAFSTVLLRNRLGLRPDLNVAHVASSFSHSSPFPLSSPSLLSFPSPLSSIVSWCFCFPLRHLPISTFPSVLCAPLFTHSFLCT